MTNERKKEIASILLNYEAKNGGVLIYPETEKEFEKLSEETKIPKEELKEYIGNFAQELVNETFVVK